MDAITLAYSSLGLQSLIGVRAHSTRGIAPSWAWSSGVSILEICEAADWASPSIFVRFYNLDVPALQARVLSAWISNLMGSLDQHCSSPSFTWSIYTIWTPGINLRDDTQATDDPMTQPVLGVFSWLPWVLLPSLGVESFYVITRHDCTCSHTSIFKAVRVKYRKGTYSVTIVTWVPWDMEWVVRSWECYKLHSSVASFEEIWDAPPSHWFVF